MLRGITLHEWQERCVDAWFDNKRRGVIKVVTGAGKTILALAIAQRLQREENQLHIAVVVPTTVLLEQWREEFANRSNLPLDAIGMMGGGHDDSFDEKVRVLICVLNSASKKLAGIVDRAGIADSLLLIVDECHRAGAAQMQHVFKTRRKYDLGLSATPERDEGDVEDIENLKIMKRAMAKRITWYQAAEILGLSGRQMLRWQTRYKHEGYDGLFDRRRGVPSPKRVPCGG